MASVGKLLGSELAASGCSVGARVCSSPVDDVASCKFLPVQSSALITTFLRITSNGKQSPSGPQQRGFVFICKANGNGAKSWNSASGSPGINVEKCRSRLEALLYCGKEIPEEKIEKPTGVPTTSLAIGNKPRCRSCEAKGAVECPTCTGSGLYVDSILESQGIIVKVKCLGCGGTGSTMCPKCGGRGHSYT